MTQYYNLEEELHTSHQELETAMEELQSTKEELETTNEELQSTNEELETTNEELQSTNEELETTNEELQSTNEELETVNQEARERTVALDDSNAFLAAVLEGIRAGMIVIDRNLQVRAWNHRAHDLWGLRAEEVGHPLASLYIGPAGRGAAHPHPHGDERFDGDRRGRRHHPPRTGDAVPLSRSRRSTPPKTPA